MTTMVCPGEWKRRYAAVMVRDGGLDAKAANEAAEQAFILADEYLTPEDAAADEMSYWVE